MTSIINLPKNIDDIVEPELLEEDWYECRIVKEPEVLPNNVLRKYMKERSIKNAEKALEAAHTEGYTDDDDKYPGMNWVISMRTVHENPDYNGRAFKKYLQLPGPGDADRLNPSGMTVEDSKLSDLQTVLTAFHGIEQVGNQAILEVGMSALFFIGQEPSFKDENKFVNALDLNMAPQAV